MIEFRQMPIQGVLFDMDGTMFDTERLRFTTIKQAATEIFGTPLQDEVLIGSLGLSALKAKELAKQHNGENYPYEEIRKRADELELLHIRKYGVPVKDGLRDILERLRKSGLSLAIATSSKRVIAEEYLINANVFKYFDITVCGDEVTQGKPKPEIFLKAAKNLNCAPENCLIIEDSANGLMAANASGGKAVFIKDIKMPDKEILNKTFAQYDVMTEFLDELRENTPLIGIPKVTDPFPSTLNEYCVGIHSFGAMGGGYLAQIFSHWDGYTRPNEIIGVTGNYVLQEIVNSFGKYSIRFNDKAFDQTIKNVHLIDTDDNDAIADMYIRSQIIGLSMPESIIKKQAPQIADGLLKRHLSNGKELVFLTIINKVSGAKFIRKCIETELQKITSPDICAEIMQKTYFPELWLIALYHGFHKKHY